MSFPHGTFQGQQLKKRGPIPLIMSTAEAGVTGVVSRKKESSTDVQGRKARVMADESIRPASVSLANGAAQDDQARKAAPTLTLGHGIVGVPAALAATVNYQTALDILAAIPEGSSLSTRVFAFDR